MEKSAAYSDYLQIMRTMFLHSADAFPLQLYVTDVRTAFSHLLSYPFTHSLSEPPHVTQLVRMLLTMTWCEVLGVGKDDFQPQDPAVQSAPSGGCSQTMKEPHRCAHRQLSMNDLLSSTADIMKREMMIRFRPKIHSLFQYDHALWSIKVLNRQRFSIREEMSYIREK